MDVSIPLTEDRKNDMATKRRELRVINEPPGAAAKKVGCLECGKCCTYVAIGINAPTTPRLATDILWHLYHHDVSVCRDEAGEWFVQFESRCRNLGEGNLCSIYETRPMVCRAYDDDLCEVNAPQAGLVTFTEASQFLDYLKAKKPKLFDKISKTYVPPHLQTA